MSIDASPLCLLCISSILLFIISILALTLVRERQKRIRARQRKLKESSRRDREEWRQWIAMQQLEEEARLRQIEQERRVRALQLSEVDDMNGFDFEGYVARLLEHQGYESRITTGSRDFGVDIIAEKGKSRYAVQVKRYKNQVSRRAVSDAVAGKGYYDCKEAMVVTNSHFSKGARELAEATECELVDRDTLAEWIIDFQTQDESLPEPIPGEWEGVQVVDAGEVMNVTIESPTSQRHRELTVFGPTGIVDCHYVGASRQGDLYIWKWTTQPLFEVGRYEAKFKGDTLPDGPGVTLLGGSKYWGGSHKWVVVDSDDHEEEGS
jgi:restriction system protein